jgi:hypothetical protein
VFEEQIRVESVSIARSTGSVFNGDKLRPKAREQPSSPRTHISESLDNKGGPLKGEAVILSPRLDSKHNALTGRFVPPEAPASFHGFAGDDVAAALTLIWGNR